MFDILTIRFLLKYFTRPDAFLRRAGPDRHGLGRGMLAYCWMCKLLSWLDIIRSTPADDSPAALLLLAGLMMFSTGLIGELVMRTYFESQNRRIYAVREIRRRREGP
jgi:hypothetical protein